MTSRRQAVLWQLVATIVSGLLRNAWCDVRSSLVHVRALLRTVEQLNLSFILSTKGYAVLQLREDVTRYRYGDEQHLDEALNRIFQFGRQKGIPRRSDPVQRVAHSWHFWKSAGQ